MCVSCACGLRLTSFPARQHRPPTYPPFLPPPRYLIHSRAGQMSQAHVISSSSQNSQSTGSSTIVGGHFRVDKKIGEGSFGVVFAGMFV